MAKEIAMLITQIPCNAITKRQDQSLNVRVSYSYQGPAQRGRLGAVVTQKTLYYEFDEIGSTRKEVYIDLPASDTLVPSYTNITGMPLAGCTPKPEAYGIKIYALDIDGKPEWGCKEILTITSVEVIPELIVSNIRVS